MRGAGVLADDHVYLVCPKKGHIGSKLSQGIFLSRILTAWAGECVIARRLRIVSETDGLDHKNF